VVFGVEDGLVSTVGFLTGIATATIDKKNILTTGIILIFVEAFSMGIGSLLSEHSTEEYEAHKEVALNRPTLAALIMFVSYAISGMLPLAPYIFLDPKQGMFWSIALSIVAIGGLGWGNAKIFKLDAGRKIMEMVVLGGMAILVGVGIGYILK
jgi:VIT1/CCC1 family predicted Fe2+/Mn2+ transporter